MKNAIIITIILASVNAFAGGGSSVGPANPASLNCLKLDGQLERIDTANGQYSNCVVEEWQLFREMSARGLVKDHSSGGMGMANPASVNCNDIGGQVRMVETHQGQFGQCVVEEWTLFRAINVTAE